MVGLLVVAVIIALGFLVSTQVFLKERDPSQLPGNSTTTPIKPNQASDQVRQQLEQTIDQQQKGLDDAQKGLNQP